MSKVFFPPSPRIYKSYCHLIMANIKKENTQQRVNQKKKKKEKA